jgi:actin-related protein
MEKKETRTVVIDNGSGFIKAGIAVLDAPSLEIPSVVAQPTKSNWKSIYSIFLHVITL